MIINISLKKLDFLELKNEKIRIYKLIFPKIELIDVPLLKVINIKFAF